MGFMREQIARWIRNQGAALQTASALAPDIWRWERFIRSYGITDWPVGGMPWATGSALLDNLLSLCFLQSKPDKTREERRRLHELRNLLAPWGLRPHHT
jgi:hypothetical protein